MHPCPLSHLLYIHYLRVYVVLAYSFRVTEINVRDKFGGNTILIPLSNQVP